MLHTSEKCSDILKVASVGRGENANLKSLFQSECLLQNVYKSQIFAIFASKVASTCPLNVSF